MKTVKTDSSLFNDRFSIIFIAVTFSMVGLNYGIGRYAYGLFLPAIRNEFGFNTFQLGLIAGLNTVIYMASTLFASATAVYFKPRTFILLSGILTTSCLAIVGLATNPSMAILGISIASSGAGFLSPALFEAIEAWLPARWKNRAIGVANAGATPGIIVTGLTAFFFQFSWKSAWVLMAILGVFVILFSAWFVPNIPIFPKEKREKLKLTHRLFLQPACYRLYLSIFVYGILLSVYLTFSVDLIVSSGVIHPPTDRLFWVFLGLAGLPSILTGEFITRFGIRVLLQLSISLCSISYIMLALAPDQKLVILCSAIIFGFSSILPGAGFLVWAISLFRKRPSIGSGITFFVLSVSFIIGPVLFGFMDKWIDGQTSFFIIAGLAFVIMPLFPRHIFDTTHNDV